MGSALAKPIRCATSFRDGPKGQTRNFEIPGSCFARPGMTEVTPQPEEFQPMFASRTRWLAIAAALSLIEIHDMSTHAISFESDRTGAAPEGWTATLTGSGDPKWT